MDHAVKWWFRRDLKRSRLKSLCLKRQSGRCAYCGGKLALAQATLDRVIPGNLGGTYAPDNVVVAHEPCNQRKDNALQPKHLKRLQGYSWLNQEKLKQICLR